ncbi:MAG: glutamine--tRNA ligase, partial [Litorivicinaceae bacterium]
RLFCERIGVTRKPNTIEYQILEGAVRDDLEGRARKGMAVLDPIRVLVENWQEAPLALDIPWHPKHPEYGSRTAYFGRELWIDRSDFEEDPPEGFFRLSPGGSVRLKYGFIVDHVDTLRVDGKIDTLVVRYDPDTRSGQDHSGRKVKGTIHWVEAETAKPVDIRWYGPLFTVPDPARAEALATVINPDSLVMRTAWVEPGLAHIDPEAYWQFERVGFFKQDPDSTADAVVYNLTVGLKDQWAKKQN